MILEKKEAKDGNVENYKTLSADDWTDPKRIIKAKSEVRGMEEMLERCGLELQGKHHSGIDDSKNIARCIIHLLAIGFNFT